MNYTKTISSAILCIGMVLTGLAEVEKNSTVTRKGEAEAWNGVSTEADLGNGDKFKLSGSKNDKATSSDITRDGKTTQKDESDSGHKFGVEFSHENKDGSKDTLTGGGEIGTNGGKTQVGVSHSEQVSAETPRHGDKDGSNWGAKGSASAEGSISATAESGNGKESAEVKAGITMEGKVSMDGRYGDDQYNVHGEGEVKLSAELVAAIKGTLQANEEGVAAAVEGKIGASVSVEGVIKGGVTVMGVPLDVKFTGAASLGAEVSGKAGFVFDPETGKAKIILEASAVVGAGLKGGVEVEVGVQQLAELIAKLNPVEAVYNAGEKMGYTATMWFLGDNSEYTQKLLAAKDWQEALQLILEHAYKKGGKNSEIMDKMIKDLMDAVRNGGSPWRAIMAATDLGRGDASSGLAHYMKLLDEIGQLKEVQPVTVKPVAITAPESIKPRDPDNGGSPLDEQPEGEGDSQGSDTFKGVTPFKAY